MARPSIQVISWQILFEPGDLASAGDISTRPAHPGAVPLLLSSYSTKSCKVLLNLVAFFCKYSSDQEQFLAVLWKETKEKFLDAVYRKCADTLWLFSFHLTFRLSITFIRKTLYSIILWKNSCVFTFFSCKNSMPNGAPVSLNKYRLNFPFSRCDLTGVNYNPLLPTTK